MRWVTLTTVDDIYQAQFLSQALEEEGIRCIEANENTATILPHLSQGVQIRVQDTDYIKAKIIADRIETMRRLKCPQCQSSNVKYMGSEKMPLKTLDLIKKLLHFPIGNHLLIYQCLQCSTTFKTS